MSPVGAPEVSHRADALEVAGAELGQRLPVLAPGVHPPEGEQGDGVVAVDLEDLVDHPGGALVVAQPRQVGLDDLAQHDHLLGALPLR